MLPVCDLDGGIPDGCLCVKSEENVETAELDMPLKTEKVDFEKLNEKLGQVFIYEWYTVDGNYKWLLIGRK